jgi:hypothetical protein
LILGDIGSPAAWRQFAEQLKAAERTSR